MISFSGIHKQYGKQLIFVDASFQLNPGEKVGLVRDLHRPPASWRAAAIEASRTGRAFSSVRLHQRVLSLTRRWSELGASVRGTAHDALAELHAEIEKARAHLAEILERLVTTAESLGMPDPQPG